MEIADDEFEEIDDNSSEEYISSGKEDLESDDDDDFETVIEKPKKSATKKSPAKTKSPSLKKPKGGGKAASGASKGKGKKAVSENSEETKMTVFTYFQKTNRPYSVINVFDNLHKTISKPVLTAIMDELAESGELSCKLYGKSKIYYLNQQNLPIPSEEEVSAVQDSIAEAKERLDTFKQKSKALEEELKCLTSSISDESLEIEIRRLTERNNELDHDISQLQTQSVVPVSPGKKDELKKKCQQYKDAWKSRKRAAMDALEQIADGMEKKIHDVEELIGIETDGDVGIDSIPSK